MSQGWWWTILLMLSIPLFFSGLGTRDVTSSHEPRAAQNATHIIRTGTWGVPVLFDDRLELQKPPLYYWCVAGLARLTGSVDGWTVRLPAALSALSCLGTLLLLGRMLGKPAAGFYAALFLATMVHFTWMARVGRIDLPLTLTTAIALAAFFLVYWRLRNHPEQRVWPWLLLMYLAPAAGVLFKGPIGLLLPGLAATTFLILQREPIAPWHGRPFWKLMRELGVWWGVPLFLAITLPWFLLANQQTQGEFFRVFFLRHNLQRGLGGDTQFEAHDSALGIAFYVLRLPIDAAPWSWLLPLTLYFRNSSIDTTTRTLQRFAFAWGVSHLLLFSMLRYKRADYLLPAYPALALWLGIWTTEVVRHRARWLSRTVGAGVLAATLGWLAFVHLWQPMTDPTREYRTFARLIRQYAPVPSPIVLFRTESNTLVFHLDRPVTRVMEWENLEIWACQPAPFYIVVPEEWVGEIENHLKAGKLYHVAATPLGHEEPLVLFCNRP